jgi:hypothetical protein
MFQIATCEENIMRIVLAGKTLLMIKVYLCRFDGNGQLGVGTLHEATLQIVAISSIFFTSGGMDF